MKLDYKRTIKVGLAFLIIMIFWEVYDFAVPLMLDRTYGLSPAMRGLVMGMDNLLAIFLLPLFGMISDKSKGKRFGRRTPFIVIGTVLASALAVVLVLIENAELNKLLANGVTDINTLVGNGYLDPKFLEATYLEAAKNSELWLEFNSAMHNAQVNMAWAYTMKHPASLGMFIATLFFLLVAMASFRSPAVAMMPDVTVKPLRSTGNAVINFMGGIGAFASIGLYSFLTPEYGSYVLLFCLLALIMLIVLGVFLLTVRENKFVAMRMEEQEKWHIVDEEETISSLALNRSKKLSLILILSTVFFWFMGYNAVKSHLSVYATTVLAMETGEVGIINFANGFGGALALIPVAFLANKLGRKKSVLMGLFIAAIAFIPCFFILPATKIWIGVLFVISGFGLIIVNVNTLPMVVELSKGSNVGRYTGYYYVATMTAQAITPYLGGLIMEKISNNMLFIYAAICIAIAILILIFVKHGDNKPTKKEIKENIFDN